MKVSGEFARRDLLKSAGLLAAGAGLLPEDWLQRLAAADEKKPSAEAAAIGQREIVKGLDGMSRVADKGNDPFVSGHNAAAVLAAAFFCREAKLDDETQKALLSLIESRLLINPIYASLPKEAADPELIAGLVKDLDTGIDTLRRSGHNIIFAVVSLKALRTLPEAVTPTRVKGLRKMVQSFGTQKSPGPPCQTRRHLWISVRSRSSSASSSRSI